MCPTRDVTWHLSTLGGDTDQHTVYFRGNTVIVNGRRVDTVSLTPGNSVTARMKPVNKGMNVTSDFCVDFWENGI